MRHAFSKVISFVTFLLAYVLCTFVRKPLTIKVVRKSARYTIIVERSSDPECGYDQEEDCYDEQSN